jgi:hypothetical protein
MNLKLLFLTFFMAITFSCGKNDDSSSVSPSLSLAELVGFTASAGTDPSTEINLEITFPSSTAGYQSVKIFRAADTAPECGTGVQVISITDFATNPLLVTESGLTDQVNNVYRACVYSSASATSSSLTVSHTTENCLIGSTIVSTPDGNRLISSLNIGDSVYSYDEVRKQIIVSRIEDTKAYGVKKVAKLSINNKFIKGVPGHRVFNLASSKYVPLSYFDNRIKHRLVKDSEFLFFDIGKKSLSVVENPSVSFGEEASAPVFDIKVEGDNNFFANGVLVQGM